MERLPIKKKMSEKSMQYLEILIIDLESTCKEGCVVVRHSEFNKIHLNHGDHYVLN